MLEQIAWEIYNDEKKKLQWRDKNTDASLPHKNFDLSSSHYSAETLNSEKGREFLPANELVFK